MTSELSSGRASRRRVLSSLAAVGVSPLLASVASTSADAESTDSGLTDALSLGTFESGLDEWETDGEVRLSRTARTDRPVAVTEGEYGLEASVDGESVPAISRPVGAFDLVASPYFVADVAPGRVDGTDARVAFRFRLYRPADSLDGDLEPVAESDPVAVRQATSGRVFWDASDVDWSLLDSVSRLELEWYPADRDPDSGDDFAYRGGVVLDAIRATDSANAVGRARLAATFRDLQFDHGVYERTEVSASSDTGEEGEFVFADGATESYRFEKSGDDRFRLAFAGTEVKLGGGWS
ncbi:hypothetical protein M0R89_06355 [Halorussus limi]|uniref:Uncharacterized protein n=1 Tax=Halorussus limi TaxID=2938695 RepID=A0A8U0HY99_9EURY|nr:hypothetical protein [Halorussus limi]UPV75681.1 hypothetical protein M0R89_06355 [Halorussus limi]